MQDISQDEVPYISLTDLIVFKLDSSGLRSNPVKKERDAQDAAALVNLATKERRGSIQLSAKQEQVVEEALCDVARCGTKEKVWWEQRMGLEKKPEEGLRRATGARTPSPTPRPGAAPSGATIPTPPGTTSASTTRTSAASTRCTAVAGEEGQEEGAGVLASEGRTRAA